MRASTWAERPIVREVSTIHGHESKATRTTGVAIHRQVDVSNGAIVSEESADVVFGGGEGQVAHVHFSIHIDFLSSASLK